MPFPGLRPFSRADAPWFFGRESQVVSLRDRLERSRFVSVVGGSGVGKSSLVFAGMMPELEATNEWCFVQMRPGRHPRQSLAEAFVRMLRASELISDADVASEALVDHVRGTVGRTSTGLGELVREWLPADGRRLLIVVDQFEEVFRFDFGAASRREATPVEDDAAALIASLLDAVESTHRPIHVVLTMRADYIGDCIRFEGLPERVSDGQYLVPRLAREQLERVICEPIRIAGGVIDHDLVEELLNDSAKEPDALPVLQHALMRLWSRARNRHLTVDLYAAIGTMREALSRHADEIVEALAGQSLPKAWQIAEATMRALADLDGTGRAIRRPLPFAQLWAETGWPHAQDVRTLLDSMRAEECSFVLPSKSVPLSADTIVDVGHEALIRHWQRLNGSEATNSADGRPSGWLWDEQRDGQIYRSLLEPARDLGFSPSPFAADDRQEQDFGSLAQLLPSAYAARRLDWWNARPRSRAWAQRYGGDADLVLGLLRASVRGASTDDSWPARVNLMVARMEGGSAEQADRLLLELRNARQYKLLLQLVEAVLRRFPRDARARRLQAQAHLELGQVRLAIDQLRPLASRLKPGHPERMEASGLLGRAYKQLFFEAKDRSSTDALAALKHAIAVYAKTFELDPSSTWYGVNLVALLAQAERVGLRVPGGLKTEHVARQVIQTLDAVPPSQRDEWYYAMRAEAALGLGDKDAVRAALKSYVGAPEAKAFMLASTLRQFTEVWDLEAVPQGAELVGILRARLLELGGEVLLTPDALADARQQPVQSHQIEAVLGELGTATWQWWKAGLDRAAAVCVVRSRLGERIGTGWLVRAGDLNREPADELLVMTNFHVVNAEGSHSGITPETAELVFEGSDPHKVYTAREILWSSPPERHDVALLRLTESVQGLAPLPLAKRLPLVDASARVYILGYPGGRGLAISMQDNALIDHEGPPNGRPVIPGVCRVHYRAPVEGGSSGSPVFNSTTWEVIALHHKGGSIGMPMLNGKPGTYAANEGIWIQSIVDAMAAG